MKQIELTQGKFALIDDEDFELISKFSWNVFPQKHTSYASRACTVDGKCTSMYMHRLIMDAPKGMDVDHIDRNGLNNQKNNLRICSRSENLRRRIPFGVSKYKGVYWCNGKSKWRAQITVKGKRMSLGSYKNEIDAAKSYDKAASVHFDEFVYINLKDTV